MTENEFMQQVKALFELCVEQSAEQQQITIDTSDASADAKQRVISLLKHQHQDDSLLTKSIIETAQHGLGDAFLKSGDVIEQYKLLKPIGEGGQGEVWLAARNDGEFNHHVAIKFIKLSHSSKELQRFQTERELLASLQHTHIARLIGGGKLGDRLYMIMEWVDGIPIIEYCRQVSLDLSQTLQLFLQICHAVGYAHSKGIIHRDIKPSNIMVDKQGEVKLLDFGIAKTLDAEVTQNLNAAMMTLAYSSPEQIEGQSISTATDVYALGLILYELLTNQQAQHHTTESAAEYFRIIADQTPVQPSLATPVNPPNFSAKKLQGDLDNLVMMTIRKEPERRYQSVESMVTDVQNYLQSKPLLASGDSSMYKMGKLFKRNPLASILSAALLAFLIILPVVMYDASIKLKKQSNEAREQAEIADATADFMTTLLKSATPLANKGEDLSMVDVMNEAEKKLTTEASRNPQVEIKLYRIFASIQHSLENNPKSIEYYQKAADLSAQIGDHEGQLSALGQKAVMHFFDNQVEQGNEALRQADEVSKNVNNAVELAWHNLRKSTNEYTKGNYQLAKDLAQNALDEMQARNNTNPEILGRIYNELAIATSEFDMEASLPYRDEAIKYAEIFHGKLHPVYLFRLGNKIFSLLKLDRYDEAEVLLNKSMQLAEKLFSRDHPEYAYLLAKEAELHFKQGNYLKAEKSRIWGNSIFKKFKGEISFQYVFGVNVLAEIYEYQGEYHKAKTLYLTAIDIRTQLDPNNLIRIADVQSNLARLLVKMGDFEAAQSLIDQAIEVYQQYKKDNLYNHLTQVATLISDGSDNTLCQSGMQQISMLSPEILSKPETNWEPMLAELWIGELAMKCGQNEMAKTHLNSALGKSKLIYTKDSVGQKRIAKRVAELLN